MHFSLQNPSYFLGGCRCLKLSYSSSAGFYAAAIEVLFIGSGMYRQLGFTLIELMGVVAVIMILTTLVLPNYQNYSIRSKLSEVVLAASSCRSKVQEGIQGAVGTSLPQAGEWGCESNATKTFYVGSITASDEGKITVLVQNIPSASGQLTMVPLKGDGSVFSSIDVGKAVYAWRCGANSDGTTIDANYLPSSCRG